MRDAGAQVRPDHATARRSEGDAPSRCLGNGRKRSISAAPLQNTRQTDLVGSLGLKSDRLLDRYFANLEGLLDSGLFDAVGHADTLLRGVPEDIFLRRFEPLLAPLARSGIAFELNASGLRKSSLDPATGREIQGFWSYPSRELVAQLIAHGVPFTVGSDTHAPSDAGAGISELLEALRPLGLKSISYYERRRRIDVTLDSLTLPGTPATLTAGLEQP